MDGLFSAERATVAQVQGMWAQRTDEIRARFVMGESWRAATEAVVAGLSRWETGTLLALLRRRRGLCRHDRMMAEALARRLGLRVTWRQRSLLVDG
jgi:hypothetical protein